MADSAKPPFLGYLTVFKSRLGLANLILGVTTLGHQSERALHRRVRQILENRLDLALDDRENAPVFEYLVDKKLVTGTLRGSGRYRGLALSRSDDGRWEAESRDGRSLKSFPVFQTDIWLSHPAIASTIGVPTPDNVEEVLEFAFQLRLLDRSKHVWTSSGQLVSGLRKFTREQISDSMNPFLLGAEAAALLRSVLEEDGLLMRELIRFVCTTTRVRRDDVAAELPAIAAKAVEAAVELGVPRPSVAEGRKLADLFAKTGGNEGASAPGVLEHRSSPRLEWLTDLGYLSKKGLAKNAFEYHVTPDLRELLAVLDARVASGKEWAFGASLAAWAINEHWAPLREAMGATESRNALRLAYEVLRRPIGPAPLRDVAFITGLLAPTSAEEDVIERVIDITKKTPGASLTGGRMSRAPENIFMSDESLRALAVT